MKKEQTIPRPESPETKLLPKGIHPGFAKCEPQPNVHRCKLWVDIKKANPEHADYKGLLHLDGDAKAFVLLWCHYDGSLGLRLEMLRPSKRKPPANRADVVCDGDGAKRDAAYEKAKAKLAARKK
jgi:hypothetical protein